MSAESAVLRAKMCGLINEILLSLASFIFVSFVHYKALLSLILPRTVMSIVTLSLAGDFSLFDRLIQTALGQNASTKYRHESENHAKDKRRKEDGCSQSLVDCKVFFGLACNVVPW